MIDLHSHILAGIDDGAGDSNESLAMAEAAAAQGISVVACTPHILPGLYHNEGGGIRKAVRDLQEALDQSGIPLRLTTGSDAHMAPDFVAGLRSGRILSIADSRYVLVEPPHHTAPPQMEDFFFNLAVAGYVPVLTHPERLSWVPSRYETIKKLVRAGVWMQITSGSFTGAFGRNALYWAQKMLDEGCVHFVASDAHNVGRRPFDMAAGYECLARRVGAEEAQHLVLTRPMAILRDEAPSSVAGPLRMADAERPVSDTAEHARKRGQGPRRGDADDRSGGDGLRGLSGRLRRLFR
ncbi:MAG TPA: CpsB/CapC family capsule biosynthesis tyrosine phosphatase [Xanthobacteraceae bacterium]|nr:CpsB/CapC family capsule biosynthesis tyrosine phosphatase [Xanthobacteraceae bacterium]